MKSIEKQKAERRTNLLVRLAQLGTRPHSLRYIAKNAARPAGDSRVHRPFRTPPAQHPSAGHPDTSRWQVPR